VGETRIHTRVGGTDGARVSVVILRSMWFLSTRIKCSRRSMC
jgi:hypothetical protein